MDAITLLFRGNLHDLLALSKEHVELHYPLARRASIKDIIEAQGVPHPEVDCLLANGGDVDFSYLPAPGDRIEILPLKPVVDVLTATVLRPEPLPAIAFAVDVNIAKLAPLLRMVGMDCWYENYIGDQPLAEIAHQQQRILLTRDTLLLKRKQVVYGHLVRSQDPHVQLLEIIDLYGLRPILNPFSRCMTCNGELCATSKDQIHQHLESLTKKYYHSFSQCCECGKIYWAGSHQQRMEKLIKAILTDNPT